MIHPIGEIHYDGARDEEVIVEIRGFVPSIDDTRRPVAAIRASQRMGWNPRISSIL